MGTFQPVISFNDLDSGNGFRIDGAVEVDRSGNSVSFAGDINGDGFADIIIGERRAYSSGEEYTGSSYVVFGSASPFSPTFSLGDLDGLNGFRIDGSATYDLSGTSVSSAGDINGDGIDDLLIGAKKVGFAGAPYAGSSFIIFGSRSGFDADITVDALDGTNGFSLPGEAGNDDSGSAVSSAGDINGDGIADLIIGAPGADVEGERNAGSSFVVFGSNDQTAADLPLESLNGANGFRIDGIAGGDYSGASVSAAGDVNDDGINDILIGASSANPESGTNAGSSYIVFGSTDNFASRISLASLDGSNGFRVDGELEGDRSGSSVSSIGDINGDGIDDFVIGARGFDPEGIYGAGASFVVFGSREGFSANFSLGTLDGTNGFRVDGVAVGDASGSRVSSAGDVNGDGFDDLMIGVGDADPGGLVSAGSTFVVFGSGEGFASEISLASLNGNNGFRLDGIAVGDFSGGSVSGSGDFNGDGVDDLLIGANGSDPDVKDRAGSTFVVFGIQANRAPVADTVSVSGDEGTVISGLLTASDIDDDELVFSLVEGPSNGSVTVNPTGSFTFTPVANFNGTDSFTFRASDGVLGNTATVTITVNTVDEPVDPVDPPAPVGPTAGDDTLIGTALNDTINALAGNDNIAGLTGDDLLIGGGGNDNINGAAGDDRLRGNGGDDTVKGGSGNDNLKGNGGADVIRGNGGDDVVRAGGGEDNVKGGGGADLIFGGGGADKLNGGGGADTLRGNGGDDTLKGNGGADVFQFRASDRNDTISDFRQGQDKIQIQSGANAFASLDIQQDGRDVLIGFGAAQVRVVTDNANAFDETDFIF